MSLHPVVRYMILCEDWGHDPDNSKRIHIHGLLSNIKSIDDPPYPLLYEELCVFLALTETRGSGKAKIICILDETGQEIFSTKEHTCNFGEDPLEVVGVPFRIKDCSFPQAGLYSIQFWYENELIAGRPLRLRLNMATDRAKNEGVRVIHEFVDQAVPDPATNIGVPKAMADSPSLDRFYKACCYRLEVGVRGDGFFDQPQVWVLIWAMVFKVGEFATGQLLKLFVEDLRRDLGYENTDDKLSGIEDRLDELNDRFRRQEGLMEEIYLEGKKLNREKLIAAMVAVGVKRGWDPDKAKKGAAEVVDQLLTDLAS